MLGDGSTYHMHMTWPVICSNFNIMPAPVVPHTKSCRSLYKIMQPLVGPHTKSCMQALVGPHTTSCRFLQVLTQNHAGPCRSSYNIMQPLVGPHTKSCMQALVGPHTTSCRFFAGPHTKSCRPLQVLIQHYADSCRSSHKIMHAGPCSSVVLVN